MKRFVWPVYRPSVEWNIFYLAGKPAIGGERVKGRWCLSEFRGLYKRVGRRGGLMVSALVSGLSSLDLSPGWGHCVVFLGKTLYSHSASLHPSV